MSTSCVPSLAPIVANKPKPVGELLLKDNMLDSSSSSETPLGITKFFIKKKLLDAPEAGAFCKNKLMVASEVSWVFDINIELISPAPSPGFNKSISTPVATPLWNKPLS